MGIAWGIIIVLLGLACWGGQAVSLIAPAKAADLTITEAEVNVEPAYWADIRGEALWDVLTLWTLPVAGVLLMLDHAWWPYLGLVGGGMYVYFAGRGILTRLEMQRRGLRIGTPQNVKTAYLFLTVWGVAGLVTIIAATTALAS